MKKMLLAMGMLVMLSNSMLVGSSYDAHYYYSSKVTHKRLSVTEKIFWMLLGVGGAASFAFWLPETRKCIEQYGWRQALVSTHLLRLAIDVATVGGAIKVLSRCS